MQFQPWVIFYFLAAIFCFFDSYLFFGSKNQSRRLLGSLVIASGFWSLMDGITQLVALDVGLALQYGTVFVSSFVAFLFLFLSYSFINSFKEKNLSLLMLIPLFVGLILSLFGDVYSSIKTGSFFGLRFVYTVYNDQNFLITVILFLIPLVAGFFVLWKALHLVKDEKLKRSLKIFTAGILFSVLSSYILGSMEVVYGIPPVSSIAISVGIAISSLSFKSIPL